MKVLVCGGRKYGRVGQDTPMDAIPAQRARAKAEYSLLRATLDELYTEGKLTAIIHGAAPGADTIAAQWAARKMIPCQAFKANWTKHKSAAGPIRNQQMLDEGKPDLVIAFPGDKGTANMVKLARKAGVPVREVY